MQAYLDEVRAALRPALCLHTFPSQRIERQVKPEVEVRGCPELLLPPVEVVRSESERCLIEQSVNATRVSFRLRSADAAEAYLARTFLRFMVHRCGWWEGRWEGSPVCLREGGQAWQARLGDDTRGPAQPPPPPCPPRRAEALEVVRREPLAGFDVTFLVTSAHLERYSRDLLLEFILKFVGDFHSEIVGLKLGLKARARAVTEAFWAEVEAPAAAAAAAAEKAA